MALVLGSSASSRALGAAFGTSSARLDAEGEASILADHLLGAFPNRRSLAVIGKTHRQEAADDDAVRDASLEGAMQDFLERLDISDTTVRHMPPAKLRARIKMTTARDFAEARIVRVDGWLLGETEARLCTIAALHLA